MRSASPVLLAVVLVTLVAAVMIRAQVAPAQRGGPLPGMMPAGVFLPAEVGACCDGFRTGNWVEYVVSRRDDERRFRMRMAAVGREGEAWWIEMTVSEARRGQATCKMLVDQGEGDRDDRLQRVIIQPEGHLALELPVKAASGQLPPLEAGSGATTLIGVERLKLRAGTFEAKHYRRGDGEGAHHIWLTEKVALWGLARYRSPKVSLSLVAQGRGAVSRIVGDPVPFDPASLR